MMKKTVVYTTKTPINAGAVMSAGNESTMTMIKNNLNQIKLTVIGDGCVGKTCVLATFQTKEFPTDYVPTIFDNYLCAINVDNEWHSIFLWDSAGSEDYNQIRPLTYPNTKCFLLCFAVNDRNSFENILIKWYPELQHYCQKVPVILVGTKSDLRETDASCISMKEAIKMKKKIKAKIYIECSALRNQNVDTLFQEAVRVVAHQQNISCFSFLKIKIPHYR